MEQLISTEMFGILLCLIAFELALLIHRKTKIALLNPLLLAILMVIAFLTITNIPVEDFQIGGNIINMMLGPTTVVLAVPLYKQIEHLKNYKKPILTGIFFGSCSGILSTILCCVLFRFQPDIIASLIPKSITTPIGIEVSVALGGIPSITVLNILITGIIGAVLAEVVLKYAKVQHPIAKGIAIGTSAHALGTTKAFELGEVEGAMSSLSIGIAGIMTVFIAPMIWNVILPYL